MKVELLRSTVGALALAAAPAAAQDYPSRPLRFIVPFAPAAATDAFARIVGQKLAERWGQPVVVDNRAGAGGTFGTDLVAKSPADGYTLLMASTSLAINATLYAKLPYDALRDFAPVSLLATLPNALFAHPALPARNIGEFIAMAKQSPGKINYGSGGIGSAAHLATEVLKTRGGIDITHVPYKGGGQALTDLMGGQISVMFISVFTALPQARAGKLKSLGVASLKRTASVPDWPTLHESGLKDFEFTAWYGVAVPARTPQPVIAKLHRELAVR